MIDITQGLLILVVVVLTALLAVIGVQIFFILRELRQSLSKTNKILDDAGLISGAVAKPIAAISNSLTEISGIAGLLEWFATRRQKKGNRGSKENV
jgi:phosphoglycerate-specific signal transduction histidine kinase